MNSDYFALSILLFSLFTYIHPFKGIHHKYKTLAERMIHKIPVFFDDPLLKVPKCYQPIDNDLIQEEFNKLYLQGQRFLPSISGLKQSRLKAKPQLANVLSDKEIKIQTLFTNNKIRNVYFNQFHGFIETDTNILIYKAIARENLSQVFKLDKKEYDQVFIGKQNIIARKKQTLYLLKNKSEHIEIQNFTIPDGSSFHQFENILIVMCSGQMFWIYIDEVLNSSIRNKRIEIFSESFSFHSGFIQNTGGVQRIFFNTRKDIASVKVGKTIKKVFQQGNIGIVQFIDNKKIVNQYFKISGLNIEFKDIKPDNFLEIAYIQGDKENGFILEPGDSQIFFRRTTDFEIISEVSCNMVTSQTQLFYSNAGIVVWEMDQIFLINQQT